MTTTAPERLGIKWPNIISARDHSTNETYCEIHLRINFAAGRDASQEISDALEQARAANDPGVSALKAILKRELKRAGLDNEGNLAIVNALMLLPLVESARHKHGKTQSETEKS